MWLFSGLLINIAVGLICAKGHHHKKVHKQVHDEHKESVQRFTIPHPSHPESAFIPEATIGEQRASIVGTELPGAYGEDYDMENGGYESGSGVVSGSGSGSSEKDNESPESPGKYGTNLVHNPPPSNPSAAFVSHMNETGDDEEEEDVAKEPVESPAHAKDDESPAHAKDDDEGQSHAKDNDESPSHGDSTDTPLKTVSARKVQKTEKPKATKKIERHHTKAERSSRVPKRKSKGKPKTHEENNMISKIDAIAKQIERVEHRESLDRKEAATLKVAKKVAKKVIKNIAAKKKHKRIAVKRIHKIFEEGSNEEEKGNEVSHRKENVHVAPEEPAGPEGFECPWACFWTCHSYCPKECCNNPFKCDLACREFCTPYCSDRCCAPGSQRLPKLQINFNGDEERKNMSAMFSEDDKHQNVTTPIMVKAGPEEEEAKHHSLDPAENSYQQLKEQEHQIAIANQMEALKKATSYAARLMGLPPECPLACARICLPGLCKPECCARSQVPGLGPIVPGGFPSGNRFPNRFADGPNAIANGHTQSVINIPGAVPGSLASALAGSQLSPSMNQLALANQFALARKQQYLMSHKGLFAPNAAASAYHQFANANNFMMNKIAYQNRLLEGILGKVMFQGQRPRDASKATYLQGLQDTRHIVTGPHGLRFIQNNTVRGIIPGEYDGSRKAKRNHLQYPRPASYFKSFHYKPPLSLLDLDNSIEKHNVAGPTSFFESNQHSRNIQDMEESTEKSNVAIRAKPLPHVRKTSYVNQLHNISRIVSVTGFKCPWSCFWKCHSYCPMRCCNNPYNCQVSCGDRCEAQCSDECCAPGLERVAKYSGPTTNKKKKGKTLSDEEKEELEANGVARKAKLDAAKKAEKVEKEREDDISFISELEALRKATTYAADVMGLPADCPAACVQICLPGWCKKHCCVNSMIRKPVSRKPVSRVGHSPKVPAFFPLKPAVRNNPALRRTHKPTHREIMEARKRHFLAVQHNRRFANKVKSNRRFVANVGNKHFITNNKYNPRAFKIVGSNRRYVGKVGNNRHPIVNHKHYRYMGNTKNNRHLPDNSGNKRFIYNNYNNGGRNMRHFTGNIRRFPANIRRFPVKAAAQRGFVDYRPRFDSNRRLIDYNGENALNDRQLLASALNRQVAFQNNLGRKRLVFQPPRHALYNQARYNPGYSTYNDQVKKQNLLFSQKAQALVQEIAMDSHYCQNPEMCPKSLRGIIRTCPKICGLSCVPQCPARCCIISKGLPPIGLSFPTDMY